MASQARKTSGNRPVKHQQQGTISQHFANSELKRHAAELSPSSKRQKLEQSKKAQQPRISAGNMYNFGTTNGTSIDLTTSSPPSPKARRISGATPLSMQNGLNTPSFGAKKLVVKNLRKNSKSDPNNYCTQTIEQLDTALTAIFTGQRPALSNEELYRGVENVCKLGKAPELAKVLEKRCKGHVAGAVRDGLVGRAHEKSLEVLRAVVMAWKGWEKQLVSCETPRQPS